MARLIDVPDDVAKIAAAALIRRDELGGGGTARGVVIATALGTGVITEHELGEIRRWHARNPDGVRDGSSTLIGGMYGGAPARDAWEPHTAAAMNPEGKGAMIALPVPASIAEKAARPDGEPADAMHVTLFHFGGDASQLDPARRDRLKATLGQFAAQTKAPTVNLTHVERFAANDGMQPATLVDSGSSVPAMREQLKGALDGAGEDGYSDDHAFRTHMTLGYYPPGEGPESGPLDNGESWTPDALELHWGDQVDSFPFADGTDAMTAALSSSYLGEQAQRIKEALPPDLAPTDASQDGLYLTYALLARAKGAQTTPEDVHDAWSAWTIGNGDDDHPSLVPFDELDGDTQALDQPYCDAIASTSSTDPVTAAARAPMRDRLAKLSATLNDTDRKLRLRLHAAAEVALTEALRQAAVKVNVKARTAKQKAMVAAAGPNIRPILAAVGVTEQELFDRRFDTLAASATGWIMAGERKKLRATAAALGIDPTELEAEYGPELDRRAIAAAGFLAGTLGVLARGALSGTQPAATGELSGPVPFGLIRDTWLIGATGANAPAFSEDGPGPADLDALATRLAKDGQTLAEELLQREGVTVQVRSTWTVGDPSRPFEPHQALDGLSWVDTQPDELNWDPGEFPFVSVLQPGDHIGCECDLLDEYEPYDGEGAPADLTDAGVLVDA